MVAGDELLSPAVLRQIGDKLYEKRKVGEAPHPSTPRPCQQPVRSQLPCVRTLGSARVCKSDPLCRVACGRATALTSRLLCARLVGWGGGVQVAALEVEQVVKRLAAANDQQRISAIIEKLTADYAFSPQANHRKV